MNDTASILEFCSRNAFRTWLKKNHKSSGGIWIRFTKGCKSFTQNDALEEAICFGWIDGLMKSINDNEYKKYFSQRKDKSNWSKKNQLLFTKLKEQKLMTKFGILAFQCKNDTELTISKVDTHSMNISTLRNAMKDDKVVLAIFDRIAVSRQKQLAGFYCEAKKDETRERRKSVIIEAIKSKNKGMLY